MFKKGHRKYGGRKKGDVNKVTALVREAVLTAFNDPRGGAGAEFFIKLKQSKDPDDRRCFAQICARLIPTEVVGAGGGPLQLEIRERDRMRSEILEATTKNRPNAPLTVLH